MIALLHGFAGDPLAWRDTIAAWPRPDELRALALPGHGGPALRATWDECVAAVGEQLDGAELVVGYSLGARVALALVASDRVRRAVLIGVNPGLSDEQRPARREADAAWARLLRERGIAAFCDAWQAQPLFASQTRVDPARLAERRARRLALDAEQLARALEVMGAAAMPDYRGALPALGDRLAIVVGAEDAKHVAIARALPVASVTLVDECGHDPTLEQPAALARILAALR